MTDIGKLLILVGTITVVVGIVLTFVPMQNFPKLPGDIYIKRGNSVFYFPIVTSILLSIILTLILNFFMRK